MNMVVLRNGCKYCIHYDSCMDLERGTPFQWDFCSVYQEAEPQDIKINILRKAVTNMGYQKKETTAKKAEVKDAVTLEEIEVLRASVINETTVGFDLKVRGIFLKGFYLRECTNKDGEKFEVISKPARKGSDGKYYDQVIIPGFTKDVQDVIIERVKSLL